MILFGILMLVVIYILWKMFIDGWLFKIILFFAGWVGLYVICRVYMESGKEIAFSTGTGAGAHSFSWAFVVPTAVCLLCLLCTKVNND
jgi:hypothetical protein